MPKQLYLLLLLFSISTLASAQILNGTVTDSTGKPLAFATIKLGDTKQGLMADVNGKFRIRTGNHYSFIIVSYLGYKTQHIELSRFKQDEPLQIILEPLSSSLEEVVIKSTTSKLKRILGNAMANKNRHNPDKYDWYQCYVYYKSTVDFIPSDSVINKDTTEDARKMKDFFDGQHMFITETYSKRSWERPERLQEDILGSRISGFKKAWFSSLVTDVLPFHAYNDFLNFNGKDYHSPLSGGAFQRFVFRLEDELLQGSDTVWLISFRPKKDAENLSGTLYISSNEFALAHIIAQHHDSSLNRVVGIEQQYSFVNGKWFPQQLNYFIHWKNLFGVPGQELYMKGISLIDSASFVKKEKFRFDKAHTARLQAGADELTDTTWKTLRPFPLVQKELRTYEFLDSLGNKHHFDRFPRLAEKLVDGFFPFGYTDIDLQRIYSFNNYEKHRIGLGLRTSDKISRHFNLGGWFGYGTGDKNWKYGLYANIYADRYKEFTLSLGYKSDLQDPGRLQIHEELDKNFLRRFLLGRVDKITSLSFEIKKKLGYWQAGIGFNTEQIIPQYNYALSYSGKTWKDFKANEIVLSLRYAYAERMSPFLGRYLSSGSKYPVVYSRIRLGEITNDGNKYIHAIAALKWQKHINRIGNEQFLLIGGGAFSQKPLPLSKLFAGNGFLIDNNALYSFGGMLTMLPYQYYSDRFINFYWKHDFDFKLFHKKITNGLSSSPSISLGYNMLWGKLQHATAHQSVQFSVPDPAYHESGIMLNRLIRMKLMGLYFVNLNAGYYYHLQGKFNHKQNGRVVFGIGLDL